MNMNKHAMTFCVFAPLMQSAIPEPDVELALQSGTQRRLADFFLAAFFAVFFGADFLVADFLTADFLAALFFLGTLAPSCRASDRPIAMACLRLVTFLPLRPLVSVPSFFSCMARSTLSPAPFEYFAIF